MRLIFPENSKVDVEIGGIGEDVDEDGVTEFGSLAARRLELITWQGYQIRVPSLEIQAEVSKR